jgi:hypothetical protein
MAEIIKVIVSRSLVAVRPAMVGLCTVNIIYALLVQSFDAHVTVFGVLLM